jgi:predicted dehydrogenase
MGLAHSARLANHPDATLVGFFDPANDAASDLRDRFAPDAVVATSFEELLKLEADAVVIGTPTTAHREQVEAAASRGWHVLCEKPLAENRVAIDGLRDLAARHSDQHFQLGYQRRFWTPYVRMKSEIESGEHGPVQAVVSVSAERWQQTIAETWRDDPEINFGGFLGDAGSHKIDMLFYVTGLAPESIFAISSRAGSHVEILTGVTGTFSNGASLTMSQTGNANSFCEELFVHCERADLILRDGKLWLGRDNQQTLIETPTNEYGYESIRNPVSGFLDLLSGRADNVAPFECARPVFDLTAAILKSASTSSLVRGLS